MNRYGLISLCAQKSPFPRVNDFSTEEKQLSFTFTLTCSKEGNYLALNLNSQS